jgi:acyl-CoA synthetase (AMP-forming)/AMP-acid ligase II/acetyltransferase-like isoleucine patch superfamily enzyme/acyl carrier protein
MSGQFEAQPQAHLLSEQSIYPLVSAWAERTPEAVAFAAPGRAALAYRRLRVQVDETVQALNGMGVGRGDRVAIVLPNGPEMAVAFLAISSAATSAPLNPAYGEREFHFYLSDLDSKALIVQAGLDSPARAVAQQLGIPIIELSASPGSEAGLFTLTGDAYSEVANGGYAHPGEVALVLHTSGTTSRPKMVPLTHANLCTSARNIRDAYQLTTDDRCLNVMPLFHIHGLVAAILSTLAAGASAVCTPGFEAAKFFDWLEAYHPSWYTAVPTMHQAILNQADAHREVIGRHPLRFIRSCSASLPPSVMAELERVFAAPALEAYGMTEASHQMTTNPLPPAERKPGSVGVATGPDVAIMDEKGSLLDRGDIGEIVIRGPSVTRGYENNPEANESAFVNGWFRTGDQGFLDEDGYLSITGRIKEIINRGGEKIAPREVDEVLLEHPAVAQAVTFAVPHSTLGEDVAAAVVLQEGASATEEELRETVANRLAPFKIPSRVVIVDEVPKGPTGKLQRSGLYKKLASKLQAEYVEPRDELELELTKIWEEVLGVQPIGVRDNFYTLGGHSLLAMSLFARVEKAFDVDLSLSSFFQTPTVENLAGIVRQGKSTSPTAEPGPVAKERGAAVKRSKQPLWKQLRNRLLQAIALYMPGDKSTRVWLHRGRGVRIGRNTAIGTSVILETARPDLISIGDNVAISTRTVITASFRGTGSWTSREDEPTVRIEDDVYIGPGAVIVPNVTIGQGAVVAAGGVVHRSVPPLTMVLGNPAEPVARCGVPLQGNSYERFVRNLQPIED